MLKSWHQRSLSSAESGSLEGVRDLLIRKKSKKKAPRSNSSTKLSRRKRKGRKRAPSSNSSNRSTRSRRSSKSHQSSPSQTNSHLRTLTEGGGGGSKIPPPPSEPRPDTLTRASTWAPSHSRAVTADVAVCVFVYQYVVCERRYRMFQKFATLAESGSNLQRLNTQASEDTLTRPTWKPSRHTDVIP